MIIGRSDCWTVADPAFHVDTTPGHRPRTTAANCTADMATVSARAAAAISAGKRQHLVWRRRCMAGHADRRYEGCGRIARGHSFTQVCQTDQQHRSVDDAQQHGDRHKCAVHRTPNATSNAAVPKTIASTAMLRLRSFMALSTRAILNAMARG